MTVQEYVMDFLPKRFGVHPAYKKVLELIWLSEECGDKAFADESFDNPRERATLGIPYQIDDLKEKERVLNVLELLIILHRQESHEEDWDNRIIELQQNTVFLPEEFKMLEQPRPKGFWGG